MRLLIAATVVLATLTATFSLAAPQSADDYDQLRAEYDDVSAYLATKLRITSTDRTSLQALRKKINAFAAEHPEDPRPVALSLQLSIWMDDEAAVDAGFEKLSSFSDDDRIWNAWAEQRIAKNRYDDALVLLVDRETDLVKSPDTALLIGNCHLARNRFNEAIASVSAIPDEALGQSGIRPRKIRIESEANRWKDLWEDEQAIREQESTDNSLPVAEILTNRGPITVLLLENNAPNTVANFINLAQQNFYDGLKFHEAVANSRISSGDPNTRPDADGAVGTGDAGYKIPDENTRDDRRLHFAGMLAMDKDLDPKVPGKPAANSAGSRWYITVAPQESRNQNYTVFGRVLDGQEIADQIRKNDEVIKVTVSNLRDKEYIPSTLSEATPSSAETTPAAPPAAPAPAASPGG